MQEGVGLLDRGRRRSYQLSRRQEGLQGHSGACAQDREPDPTPLWA